MNDYHGLLHLTYVAWALQFDIAQQLTAPQTSGLMVNMLVLPRQSHKIIIYQTSSSARPKYQIRKEHECTYLLLQKSPCNVVAVAHFDPKRLRIWSCESKKQS